MYIPEHFRVRHHEEAIAFMRANPFAILISTTSEGPFGTHVPVVIREDGEKMLIRGHVAKANPHWRYLEEQADCLMIFHGPHAYVSASNYATRENVPTWNYGAVHAYGRARTFHEPDRLLGVLHELIPTFEAAYAEQWNGLDEAYHSRMLTHIVGFEIEVAKLEAKFKLSQNRTRDEQQRVIDSLGKAKDTTVVGTAELMCTQGLGTGKETKKE
jgi:transcriptional regulator